ncbi:papain-like cysteine peptidase [Klebsiella quasipneumoniae subsp. quasipneumoniae]|nr:DUF1796 family putative cysteine peptidase [Klebsiella quasipneumoniae]MCD7063482.1 papain-like cysteine peptidase [Klebsiella quasipneumoniae subsp. similipneumoniae]MDE4646168.1 DUF1796 family putative cysteine peptidase [Klebsiella quasipneumoniae subsp. similipneumoniae]MDG0652730.1 papain-like cysteine peptidase [Klebsiella quasipneumoniae]MEB6583504.1 papain-like cysteine peptidase [Klebsiella quasipneumoniae]
MSPATLCIRDGDSRAVGCKAHCVARKPLFNIADTEKIQSENTSLPFDWIFSCPAMVIDCLKDDFHPSRSLEPFRRITSGQ